MIRRCLLSIVVIALAGCSGSRWAREDPVYGAKYPDHSDNVLQMAKQAVDARHVENRGGWALGGEFGKRERGAFGVGASVSRFQYSKPWLEGHLGLTGLATSGEVNLWGGLDGGMRIQSPSRFAPFAGLGAFAGVGAFERDRGDDGLDNDGNGYVDDETEKEVFGTVYPELGAHFWIQPDVRLTASARYQISTAGRDHDLWMFGVSVSVLDVLPPTRIISWDDSGQATVVERLPAVTD